jgi:hypothetical protein
MSKKQFAVMLVVAAVAGLLGAVASHLLIGQPAYAQVTQSGTGVVDAQQFRLVTTEGTVLATLGPEPALSLLDSAGRQRASLMLDGDGKPLFGLFDADSKVRYWVALQQDGRPAVVLRNGDEKAGMLLRVRPDGSGEFSLRDETEQTRILLGPDDNKAWGMSLRNASGEATWTAP